MAIYTDVSPSSTPRSRERNDRSLWDRSASPQISGGGYYSRPSCTSSERSSCESDLARQPELGLYAPPPPAALWQKDQHRDARSTPPTSPDSPSSSKHHFDSSGSDKILNTMQEMPAEPAPIFFPPNARGSPSPIYDPSRLYSPGGADAGYSDKIVSPVDPLPHSDYPSSAHSRALSPNGMMTAGSNYTRGANIRALSPLPERIEIAVPPGATIPRTHTPDQFLFRPDVLDHDAKYISRSATPEQVYGSRAYSPSQRAPTPHSGRPITPASAYDPSYRASPTPTTAYSISGYRLGYHSPASVRSPSHLGPRRKSHHDNPAVSSPFDLNVLWNAAQGAHPIIGDGKIYIMNMYREAPDHVDPVEYPEHFSFGPTFNRPFFKIETPLSCGGAEVRMARQNTFSGDVMDILTMQLPLDGCPTADGLVTQIYPKRAVLAAMNVAPSQASAVSLAGERECCRLLWSKKYKRYELLHPAMSSSNTAEEAALVVKIEGSVGFDHPTARGSIKLVNMTNRETLCALDFGRSMLFVNTAATSKVPSKHIVDVAVSTLFAVGICEGRRFKAWRLIESAKRCGTPVSHRGAMSPSPVMPHAPRGVYVEKLGSKAEVTAARAAHRAEEPGCGSLVVKVGKGLWMLVYFTGRLGYEIVKAIVDAFRPVKK